MTRDEFLDRFGPVFEHRPDLAAAVWDSGPPDPARGLQELHGAFVAVLRALPPDALLAFLNGHPDLSGRAARPGDLTADSRCEQGSAGLDDLGDDEGRRFQGMNRAYRERFGFPFIMAVKGRRSEEIVAAFEARLRNPAAEERAEALRQVERILLLRLEDKLAGA